MCHGGIRPDAPYSGVYFLQPEVIEGLPLENMNRATLEHNQLSHESDQVRDDIAVTGFDFPVVYRRPVLWLIGFTEPYL
jgi:hypothetical protein